MTADGDLTLRIQQGGELHGMQVECTPMLEQLDFEAQS